MLRRGRATGGNFQAKVAADAPQELTEAEAAAQRILQRASQEVPMEFSFTVNGKPATQGSKTYMRGRAVEANRRLPGWRSDVANAVERAVPDGWDRAGAMEVEMWFRYARPQHHFRANGELKEKAPVWHTVLSGDVDKLSRAVNDAITTGGGWVDDKQLCSLVVKRQWCEKGELPGVSVVVRKLE